MVFEGCDHPHHLLPQGLTVVAQVITEKIELLR